jgi:hypothetical protein
VPGLGGPALGPVLDDHRGGVEVVVHRCLLMLAAVETKISQSAAEVDRFSED